MSGAVTEAYPELARMLFRPIVFMPPDRTVHPPSWLEHVPFAFWLIDVLRPRVFVELGTHAGNSYGALAQAVQQLGLDAAGYAVDTWAGNPQAGFYDESVFVEWKAYHDQRYTAFSTLVRTTFDDALGHFRDGSVNLLNLDGFHSRDAVRHDFESWLPKVSARGVVLLHDINVRERDFGAWEVWADLRATYPTFEFLHGHGLGVAMIGSEITPELEWLIRADSARAVAVREFFARTAAASWRGIWLPVPNCCSPNKPRAQMRLNTPRMGPRAIRATPNSPPKSRRSRRVWRRSTPSWGSRPGS